MKRRSFLGLPLAFAWPEQAYSEAQPWSARVLKGGFDGTHWWVGFGVKLQPKWKTYWRVPGDGGIAPQITVAGENLKSYEVLYPLPRRFEGEDGMTIGYKDDVVFPAKIEPGDALKPLSLQLSGFIGVCEVVCIPAQHSAELSFDPENADAPDQSEISQWQAKVPIVKPSGPVISATALNRNAKPELELRLAESVNDIFVEGSALHFFGKPNFAQNKATLAVNGAKTIEDIKATPLRITIDSTNGPLEQVVTVV
jgi:DsbC/DsbD-like thiol-disulfide interchange protein